MREKWAFWKGIVGKKRWKFDAKKEKKAERVLKSLKVQKHRPFFLEVRIPGNG